MINKHFEKIFIITLEDSKRHHALRHKFNFDYEIFYGVDGRYIDKKDSIWTNGQLGCTLSHINLYKHIIDNNIQSCLILEDDAVANHNINNVDVIMKQLPEDWGMMYLGWGAAISRPNYKNNWFLLERDKSFKIVEHTHAIGLQLDYVKDMYEFNKNWNYTADGAYTEAVKQLNKKCFLSMPKVFDIDTSPSVTVEVDKWLRGEKNTIFDDNN